MTRNLKRTAVAAGNHICFPFIRRLLIYGKASVTRPVLCKHADVLSVAPHIKAAIERAATERRSNSNSGVPSETELAGTYFRSLSIKHR